MKRVGLATFGVAGAIFYLAIGVWGWGSFSGYFSNPARLTIAVMMLSAGVASAFSNSSGLGTGVREDKSNRWVLAPLIGAGLLLPWLTAYLDAHNEWVTGGQAIRWLGVGVCLLGICLRLIPVFELGRRFSGFVAIQPDHQLKTDGLYRFIRHPSYLGLLITAFGWALAFRCVLPGLAFTAINLIAIVARMNSEERLLVDQFGEQFRAYKKRTWRLVPWVY